MEFSCHTVSNSITALCSFWRKIILTFMEKKNTHTFTHKVFYRFLNEGGDAAVSILRMRARWAVSELPTHSPSYGNPTVIYLFVHLITCKKRLIFPSKQLEMRCPSMLSNYSFLIFPQCSCSPQLLAKMRRTVWITVGNFKDQRALNHAMALKSIRPCKKGISDPEACGVLHYNVTATHYYL